MPISAQILDRISSNDPTLIELDLSLQSPPLDARDMAQLASALKTNTKLKLLILADNAMLDEGAKKLAEGLKFSQVETVDVSGNKIGNAGIDELLQTPIESLKIVGNSFDDDAFRLLARNSKLKFLYAYANNLTDGCAQYLQANEGLLAVVLDEDKLSPGVLSAVQQHVGRNAFLHAQKSLAELKLCFPFLNTPERIEIKKGANSIFEEERVEEQSPSSSQQQQTRHAFFPPLVQTEEKSPSFGQQEGERRGFFPNPLPTLNPLPSSSHH